VESFNATIKRYFTNRLQLNIIAMLKIFKEDLIQYESSKLFNYSFAKEKLVDKTLINVAIEFSKIYDYIFYIIFLEAVFLGDQLKNFEFLSNVYPYNGKLVLKRIKKYILEFYKRKIENQRNAIIASFVPERLFRDCARSFCENRQKLTLTRSQKLKVYYSS
jgi:hypothetical protein